MSDDARFVQLTPMLMCKDVQASIVFYTDILGFDVLGRMDDVGRSGFASLGRGEVQIMLASPGYIPRGELVEGRFPQSMYYLYVENIAGLHQRVIDAGYQVSDLTVRFYGNKEFELVDPDGHVLTVAEETDEPPTPED